MFAEEQELYEECYRKASAIGDILTKRKENLALAESCTGGLISFLLTEIPGSSAWFDRTFVAYANDAKKDMLGVNIETLLKYGAVSSQTVYEMGQGVVKHSKANWAIAISGIAGPTGGTEQKPVGTIFFSFVHNDEVVEVINKFFEGSRTTIRLKACLFALSELKAHLEDNFELKELKRENNNI